MRAAGVSGARRAEAGAATIVQYEQREPGTRPSSAPGSSSATGCCRPGCGAEVQIFRTSLPRRNAVAVQVLAVVETNSRTVSPGAALTRSANPSIACSGPGVCSVQSAFRPVGGAVVVTVVGGVVATGAGAAAHPEASTRTSKATTTRMGAHCAYRVYPSVLRE
jgi:hypothetical protein